MGACSSQINRARRAVSEETQSAHSGSKVRTRVVLWLTRYVGAREHCVQLLRTARPVVGEAQRKVWQVISRREDGMGVVDDTMWWRAGAMLTTRVRQGAPKQAEYARSGTQLSRVAARDRLAQMVKEAYSRRGS